MSEITPGNEGGLPVPPEQPQMPMKPHRGTTVLVLGILSLVALWCYGVPGLVLGIITWVMASGDLRQMAAGTMDPSGRGNVIAGRICGIIALIMSVIVLVAATIILVAYFATRPGGFKGKLSIEQGMEQRGKQLGYANAQDMWEHGNPTTPNKAAPRK